MFKKIINRTSGTGLIREEVNFIESRYAVIPAPKAKICELIIC